MATLDDWPTWSKMFVHPRFGIIKSAYTHPALPEFPKLFSATAVSSDPNLVVGRAGSTNVSHAYGHGISPHFDSAMRQACAEAIERYAAAIWYPDDLFAANGEDLPSKTDELIDRMILWHGRHHPYHRSDVRNWTMVRSWTDGVSTPFPAQSVLWGYSPTFPNETLVDINSNGHSAGPTLDEAILRGVLEIIERDSFICHWLLRLTPRRLCFDVNDTDLIPEALSSFIVRRKISVQFLLLGNEFDIPVVFCIMKGGGSSAVGYGASCRFDVRSAMSKAVDEAYATYAHEVVQISRGRVPINSRLITNFQDHLAYYQDPIRASKLSFLTSGTIIDPPKTIVPACGLVEYIRNTLFRHGYEIIYKDFTGPDLQDAGIHAVKVLIPGLQPLYLGRQYPRDFRRVRRFAKMQQIKGRISPISWVHPFP